MSELSIGRLTATVEDWPDPDQVPRMLQGLAADRLDAALRAQSLPEGEWCVRRVDLALRLDPERPASALETDWADQIVVALRQSLRDGGRDVVRFERREDALDELLVGLATGRHEHAWAWRQVGLLDAGDPAPETNPRALCLQVLERLPHGVAGTLCRLVRTVGPAAVHRLLGSAGWSEVAACAAREVGLRLPALVEDGPAHDHVPARRPGAGPTTTGASDPDRVRAAAGLCASSLLHTMLRDSGLRTDVATRRAWAVLVLAEVDPSGLRSPGAPALVAAVARLLDRPVGSGLGNGAGTHRPGHPAGYQPGHRTETSASRPTDATQHTGPRDHGEHAQESKDPSPAADDARRDGTGAVQERSHGPGASSRTALRSGAEDPVAVTDETHGVPGEATAWGGLLFLLNSAADAGLPEALEEEPFLGRPTGWVLQQLGTRLVGAAADDPAVLALGVADTELAAAQPPADEGTRTALDGAAARWAEATAFRLRAGATSPWPGTDLDVVRRLTHRRARVLREPGWVEVQLRLDDVDLDVRRSGLDLDPGWVWWLGQVVRFGYE